MRLFSPEHMAAIAATGLAALVLAAAPRRLSRPTTLQIARALAILILAGFVIEQITYVARGEWSARRNLPLQLSDAVTLVSIAALWRPRAGLLTELVFFWAFSASLQGLLTPDLPDTFPDVLYFTYFATHGGVIVAACLLVLGLRLLPRRWAVWRVYGLTAAFAALAAIGSVATGGNYMFLRNMPSTGSILDPLGPWPVYILGAAVIGLAMLLVLEGIARALARREEGAPRSADGRTGTCGGRSAPVRAVRRILAGVLAAMLAFVALLGIEALIAVQTVPDDGYRAPSQAPRTFGDPDARRSLRYVVLGDSTAAGRGAPYESGIAVLTARGLAADRQVTLTNLAVSGARMGDVRSDQLPAALDIAPDVVFVSAGANDVTGLTRLGSVRDDLEQIVQRLRDARREVAIVVTGSPDMGAPPRIPQPLRAIAGWRGRHLTDVVREVVRERDLVLAPIAELTGRRFRADRSLFAADGFHPSAAGYAIWVPVIQAALDRALTRRDTPPEA